MAKFKSKIKKEEPKKTEAPKKSEESTQASDSGSKDTQENEEKKTDL